jgi:rhamnosyltransferase subunit B
MRVLISTAGSHGDVLPFIALGREFASRGHEVILYANPFFLGYTTDSAIGFVPISTTEKYALLFGELSDGDPNRAFKRVAKEYAEICPQYYQAMRTDVIPGDTIAIGNSLLFPHRLLRETDGVPCATVHLAPSVFRSNVNPARLVPKWITSSTPSLLKRMAWWMLDKTFYDPNFTVPLNKYRGDLGLPAVDRIFSSWIHEADCVVGLFPDWFATPQSDWPEDVVLVDFPLYDQGNHSPLPPELDEFIQAGQPPVAFSAGTATATAHEFFKTSVDASETAGLRAILLTHFRQQVPASLPKNVIHVDYAPFSSLLPRLAAFAHHGGIGSTSQALHAGIPQLIRPVAYDQFDNSARTVRLGVAQEVLPKQYASQAVANVLSTLTTDKALHHRCQQVASQFTNRDPIGTACDVILSRLCR